MFDYKLALMTGIDFPIPELQVVIHQPTLKEISMIGETEFFLGVQVLSINKNVYIQDEQILQQITNFDVFMSIMNEKEAVDKKAAATQVLMLLFPQYKVNLLPRSIMLSQNGETFIIDERNFEVFQKVISEQFCLKGTEQQQFNPQSKKAREIAQKLMKARQRVAEIKAAENSGSILGLYLSVLVVGTGSMSLQQAGELTMYQLYDLIERYHLYINWDIDIRSRMAGAKADKPLENWMKQIH